MPEKPGKYKFIFLFFVLSLPPVLLLITAWILSLNTSILKSQGQVLLIIIIALGLLFVSSYVIYSYTQKHFINPVSLITATLRGILARAFKPLPPNTNLGSFSEIYHLLEQLQGTFSQDIKSLDHSNKISKAELSLFETSTSEVIDPLIVVNLKLEVKFLNQAAEAFTGIKKVDALGRRIDEFIRLYDKNNSEILSNVYLNPKNPSQESKVFFNSETKIISGTNWQGFADVSVFKFVESELIDVAGIILLHDKTKEKQLEAMKLDFVSMAAHELRTPLTSIKGYISVFINENQNKLTPDQLMFVRRINTSAQQLSGLVENLLSVARVERGALTLHRQIIDWVGNVSSQLETFLHRAEEKRITLTFVKPTTPIGKVDVDLVRINEVLNNIISNALNYTEPLGKIEVSIDQKDGMVTTYVKDTGKGISKESLPRLFSKFFRVQGGPAEQASKGNGLGLYLSKAIVELHNGKIWATSEGLGKGSTFAFSLPAIRDNIDLSVLTKAT